MTPDLNEIFDRELIELIEKTEFRLTPPELPETIHFPFMMVFHRKKVTERNTFYLVAAPIRNLTDLATIHRSIKHKGWPTMTLMFDVPPLWVELLDRSNRYLFWKFHSWKDIKAVMSDSDRMLLPDLEEMFPCPIGKVKGKNGQYKLIF